MLYDTDVLVSHRSLQGHTGPVTSVFFIGDTLKQETDLLREAQLAGIRHEAKTHTHPHHIASASQDGTIRLWSLPEDGLDNSSCQVLRFSEAKPGMSDRPIHCLAVNGSSTVLAAGMAYQGISLWNLAKEEGKSSFKAFLAQNDGPVTSLAFHPEGLALLAGAMPNMRVEGKPLDKADGLNALRLWDIATENTTAVLLKHNEHVSSCVFSPDGGVLLAAIEYGDRQGDLLGQVAHPHRGITMFVRGYDMAKNAVWKRHTNDWGDPIMMTNHDDDGPNTSITITPDGKNCIAVSECGTMTVWDHMLASKVSSIQDCQGIEVIPTHITFPPDSPKDGSGCFTTCGFGGVKLWDLQFTKECALLRKRGHHLPVSSISFNNDGTTLASTGGRYVKLWSRTGHLEKEIQWRADTQADRRAKWRVQAVAFTPDGSTLACVFAHAVS